MDEKSLPRLSKTGNKNELYEKKRMCIMESTSVQSFFVIAGVAWLGNILKDVG